MRYRSRSRSPSVYMKTTKRRMETPVSRSRSRSRNYYEKKNSKVHRRKYSTYSETSMVSKKNENIKEKVQIPTDSNDKTAKEHIEAPDSILSRSSSRDSFSSQK
jgi:hypothetical protein